MSEKCKSCLNICRCCSCVECNTCKPFGKNFKLAFNNKCGITSTKYKPGDKVTINAYLKIHRYYPMLNGGAMIFTQTMAPYRGKTVTIDRITMNGFYNIKEDFGSHYWSDGMFRLE